MANLTITVANTGVASLDSPVSVVQVGEAVDRMQPGYYNTSDGKYWKARANGTEEQARVRVMFMSPAAADGTAIVALPGAKLIVGATLVKSTQYALSASTGLICLHSDLVSGNHAVDLGIAESSTVLIFQPDPKGITK